MVFQDLSHYSSEKPKQWHGASVADRILAFFVDFLLLTPVWQLLLAPFSKKIELLMISAPESLEMFALIGVGAFFSLLLIIVYQTVCLTLWGATPGKYFLKLRVVSLRGEGSEKLVWTQALLRSVVWCCELFAMGVPFLEVLSHHQRMPLHDRAAETGVKTLKVEWERGPHPLESHFVRQIIFVFTVFVVSWMFFGVGKIYRLAQDGGFKKDELVEEGYLCRRVSEDSSNRVDEALALFLMAEVSPDCVEREADFVLWSPGTEKKDWAYLAKGILMQDQKSVAVGYFAKSCQHNPESEACIIAQRIQDKANDSQFSWGSLTAKVLQLESLERQGELDEVKTKVAQFPSENFREPLVGYLLRALWSGHQLERARGIFEAQNLTADTESKKSLAAWMCLQELDIDCEKPQKTKSCELVSELQGGSQLEVSWAQLKLRDCRKSAEPALHLFHELFTQRPDFRGLVEASSSETSWPADKRVAQLEKIARSAHGLLQSFAVHEWIRFVKDKKQLENILDVLESQSNHDWKWQANVLKTFQRASKLKEYEVGFEISQLLQPQVFANWDLQKELVVTAYKANEKKWALDYWKSFAQVKSNSANRGPASLTEDSSEWKSIEQLLQKMGSHPE